MLRCLLCASIGALFLVPVALASGGPPSPGVLQGGVGLLAPGGGVRYVTIDRSKRTFLEAVSTKDGKVRAAGYAGRWGIPAVALDGSAGGLSTDGGTLVLAERGFVTALRSRSFFRVVDTKTLLFTAIALRGDFAFDALSPDGRTLYLIQHVSSPNLTRYVVRAYDLERARLLPGRIADRTQRGWVMQGYPVTRVTSAGGRRAYTLYQNPGGYPFVHALDTVRGVAHCIGIPWTGDQSRLFNLRLSLRDGGRTLALRWRSGRAFLAVDTQTFRVRQPGGNRAGAGGGDGFLWWAAGLGAGGAVAVLGALLLQAARRRGPRGAPAGA
ncbi:MAG: hypothetical protein WBB74_10680 [Gaiellaceae bacterium]